MYIDALAQFGVGGSHPGGITLTKQLIAEESIDEQTAVLDIGCGTGMSSAYLYEHCHCQITACDIHPTMIKKANERFQKSGYPIKADYGNAEALEYAAESFEYVISESVTTFTNRDKSLFHYYRVLKPKGKLIAIEMIHHPSLAKEEKEKIKEFYRFQSFMTEIEWKECLVNNNFSNIKIRPYYPPRYQDEQMYDLSPSEKIKPELYDVVLKHEEIMLRYQEVVFPAIIICEK